MKVFAISDLHLSGGVDNKPMDIFGEGWQGYMEKIESDWKEKVGEDDVVLLAGDLSWGMNLAQAECDIARVGALSGKKVIIKGNHDYWWSSLSKLKEVLPDNMYVVQNNCVRIDSLLVCGSRLWQFGQSDDDKKLLAREKERLSLSLNAMQSMRLPGDKVVVMCHYPPFDASYSDNDFTDMISRAGVDAVVYGHLHGKGVRTDKVIDKHGLKYYLISCDLVGNKLVRII